MEKLLLIEPTIEHEPIALDYKREYIAYGETHINGSAGFMKYNDYSVWLNLIKHHKCIKKATEYVVPATTFFTLRQSDNKIIGSIQLRHELNDDLLNGAGHIGYGIRPSERGKGYGAQQLALVLEKAKEIGLRRVMVSCNKENIASAKTAMKNGGILEGEKYNADSKETTQFYWIELSDPL